MTVHLEKRGRRIVIRSDEPLPGLRSTVPGAYETVSGDWTVPLSIESCKLLRGRYGRRLVLGDELRRWARGVVDNRAYMAKLATATDAELQHVPDSAPELAKAIAARPYQRVAARFLADNPASLVADDPGLGKTLEVMAGILEAEVPGPYLIVAPKTSADTVWRREITRWLPPEHRAITLPDFRDQREKVIRLTRYGDTTWLIVHPEIVMVQVWWECAEMVTTKRGKLRRCRHRTPEGSKQQRELNCGHIRDRKTVRIVDPSYPRLFDIQWGAIVVDESHESLIRRTGTPTQRRRGLEMLKLREDGMRIAVSGTPFDSKPHQLWGTLNWLDSNQYSAFHRWAELYWEKTGYNGFQIGDFRKDREGLLWDSLSAIALRRTKAEVAQDLPPKMYVGTPLTVAEEDSPVGVWLEMEGKQERAYRDIENLSVTQMKSGRLEATTALAELTRLKQLACAYGDYKPTVKRVRQADGSYSRLATWKFIPRLPSNKFKWTVEALEEWGYPKDPLTKVVIVSWYTGILEMFGRALERHFKTKPNSPLCTAITGRTPSGDRRAIIDRFNQRDKGSPQVMLLNVKAGGTAITLDTADRMIFISETRNPDQQKQAEDRIHRVSNPRHCMYYYLRSLGTVDVGTSLMNQERERESHRLLDERRGVDYFRHVVELSGLSAS